MTANANSLTPDTSALHVPSDGLPVKKTPMLEHECSVAGIRVMALPPGEVELNAVPDVVTLNVVRDPCVASFVRIGGTDYTNSSAEQTGMAWYPPGVDIELRCSNPDWEALIEIDPRKLALLASEPFERYSPPDEFVPWKPDPLIGAPVNLLIDHLRRPTIDPLFVEGLTLAVIACGIRLTTGTSWLPSPNGMDRRVRRALDYIEAYLPDQLSIATIASVAAMSPSHFARSFKSATGEAVWAYVMRRRTERAREMLARTDLPQAIVAHRCGFSDAGHLRRALRRRG